MILVSRTTLKYAFGLQYLNSQEYKVPDIIEGLLEEVGEKESNSQNISELGQKLRKKLFGRKYLIVLDDVWSTNVWDDLKIYFPDTSEGSRIIVTTRLSNISDSLGKENSYSVDLLNDEKSWELLCEKAFGKVGCPNPNLEKIGRTIAGGCKGLPLAIVVIGGDLSKLDVTLEKWKEVARNVNSIVNSEDDEFCLNILSLSYNQLRVHLKLCFLYMRVYPKEYYKVRVSQLIQPWIAEGFVISKGDQNLEEVAGEYLKDLNLILTNHQFVYGAQMKRMVDIYDLLRDLCIKENRRENTSLIAKVFVGELMKEQEDFEKRNFAGCVVKERPWLHLFWNLRSIVYYSSDIGVIDLPSEIWNMPQLRHVNFYKAILPEPPVTSIDGKDSIILESLETLGTLVDFSCSKEILARIPNVKNLKIDYFDRGRDSSYFKYHNLTRLHKLESLTISWPRFYSTFPRVMEEFPRSLKKLTLKRCQFYLEDMTIIVLLPNLEVLKLHRFAFEGESWNPIEGEFLQLKKLSSYESFLVTSNAEKEHFPRLESLILREMDSLMNFPSGIGEIDTLLSITLYDCSNELVNWAKEVVAEQQTYGNAGLQLHVIK